MFKELFEKTKSISAKDLAKLVKKDGDVPVIILGQDIWVNIDSVEDGYAYGIDQFDDDREIDLSKETLQLAEALKTGILTTYLEYPADVKNLKKYLDNKNIKYKAAVKNRMTRFEIDNEDKDKKISKYVADTFGTSLIRKLTEAKNPYSHKGGSDSYSDATKIENLQKKFDFYAHMIDDYSKQKKVEAKNKEIKAQLKKLGVTEIKLDKETRKI